MIFYFSSLINPRPYNSLESVIFHTQAEKHKKLFFYCTVYHLPAPYSELLSEFNNNITSKLIVDGAVALLHMTLDTAVPLKKTAVNQRRLAPFCNS